MLHHNINFIKIRSTTISNDTIEHKINTMNIAIIINQYINHNELIAMNKIEIISNDKKDIKVYWDKTE